MLHRSTFPAAVVAARIYTHASRTHIANSVGEYNCFLNSLVQSLYHINRFRGGKPRTCSTLYYYRQRRPSTSTRVLQQEHLAPQLSLSHEFVGDGRERVSSHRLGHHSRTRSSRSPHVGAQAAPDERLQRRQRLAGFALQVAIAAVRAHDLYHCCLCKGEECGRDGMTARRLGEAAH